MSKMTEEELVGKILTSLREVRSEISSAQEKIRSTEVLETDIDDWEFGKLFHDLNAAYEEVCHVQFRLKPYNK